jgi:hypothetical protein
MLGGCHTQAVRLPPALAAKTTDQVLRLLPPPPACVLELGFAGIHAGPLRLAGFQVVVVELDPASLARARERSQDALDHVPAGRYDAVVAPEGTDLAGIEAEHVILVGRDGAAYLPE